MSREVRRVPESWQHPKDARGKYIPLLHHSFTKALAEWTEENAKWQAGLMDVGAGWEPKSEAYLTMTFEHFSDPCPQASDYMPKFPESECTHLQMYETCSEGTPISPVMFTPEELAHWLADNGASAFGSRTASYEAWLATIEQGYSIGCLIGSEGAISGVEMNLRNKLEKKKEKNMNEKNEKCKFCQLEKPDHSRCEQLHKRFEELIESAHENIELEHLLIWGLSDEDQEEYSRVVEELFQHQSTFSK